MVIWGCSRISFELDFFSSSSFFISIFYSKIAFSRQVGFFMFCELPVQE